MFRRIQVMLLCSVLCWLCAGTAQAGFVSPDFLDGSSSSMSVSQSSSDEGTVPEEKESPLAAFMDGSDALNAGTSGGMSGGSASTVQMGASALATATVPQVDSQLISGYLAREADSVLPEAFLDRQFRPPRSTLALVG